MKVDSKICNIFREFGIFFIVSVPCAQFEGIIKIIEDSKDISHISATREEEGIGIAAGITLGGKNSIILMNDSGLGNSLITINNIINNYDIPLIFLIPQNRIQEKSLHLLNLISNRFYEILSIKTWIIEINKDISKLKEAILYSREQHSSVAIMLDESLWGA
jgi:sulfopyruvate decarboxylase subunit alpha